MRLVLLHGYGSKPSELDVVSDSLRGRGFSVECPSGSIELTDGSRAWFDDPFVASRAAHTQVAMEALVELGERVELAGAFVCGFSQGGAMAIAASFSGREISGAVSVCGFLPEGVVVTKSSKPMLLVAGDADQVVDPFYSESLARQAKKVGCPVTLATVSSGHKWTPEVSDLVASWVTRTGGDSQ